MCWTYLYQHPVCNCIYVSDAVIRCSLFSPHPDNKSKTVFRPKLITARCEHLNLIFNGMDYASVDFEKESDIVPTGLDCPEVEHHELKEDEEEVRGCALCDSEMAIRFIRVKGVEYTFDKAALARELEVEAASPNSGDAKAQAAGEGVESSAAEPADVSGSGSAKKGRTKEPSLLQDMIASRMMRAAEGRTGLKIDLDGEGNWLGSKNR